MWVVTLNKYNASLSDIFVAVDFGGVLLIGSLLFFRVLLVRVACFLLLIACRLLLIAYCWLLGAFGSFRLGAGLGCGGGADIVAFDLVF